MSASRIRDLNDRLRTSLSLSRGQLLITQGVAGLPARDLATVLRMVREFDTFTPDNDPYGEHDFGAFTHAGQKFFWKIDYYDAACEYGSPDPADSSVTRRVLTVMLAGEY